MVDKFFGVPEVLVESLEYLCSMVIAHCKMDPIEFVNVLDGVFHRFFIGNKLLNFLLIQSMAETIKQRDRPMVQSVCFGSQG